MEPHFSVPISQAVKRFGSNERCELRSADGTLNATRRDIETVAEICNEPLIYNRLFRTNFKGQLYTPEHAEKFLQWAREGWQKNAWFVFLIRDAAHQIVAAIDIKTPTLAEAEIGYWASASYPGVMTNTVVELCRVAEGAGYRRLFAVIEPDNERSISVIKRAGFLSDGEMVRNEKRYLRFICELL